ncbi:MAG TPA: hypothetical protein VF006_28480 [Longimicrobium sp.]
MPEKKNDKKGGKNDDKKGSRPVKEPAARPPAAAGTKSTEQVLLESIQALRENPEKYARLREALQAARTDEERVKQLLHFATSKGELAALMPARAGGADALAWTTVTVTTILIPNSAY